MTNNPIKLPKSISKYLPYYILDMSNRSASDREKFLSLMDATFQVFDRRSEIAPDGLRYNQTIAYAYQSTYAQIMYMIKIGIDSGVITETEAKAYAVKMNEVHWTNLEFELINPAVDYTKLATAKKSRAKKITEPKEKKERKPKAEPVKPAIPKIKIDFGDIKVKMT